VRRETRLNLVFLTAFIVVTLPGAVILFKKKLDPTAHRLDQPDPILNHLPYMVPPPAPPNVKWVVPDRTQAWVQSLTAPTPTVSAGPPGPQWEPVISADHRLQLLARSIDPKPQLTFLLWDGVAEPRIDLFTVSIDGHPERAHITRVRPVPLPADVRRELVMMGFVRPPVQALVLEVDFQTLTPGTKHVLDLSYTTSANSFHSSIELAPAANDSTR
jgi:hypothetical protein